MKDHERPLNIAGDPPLRGVVHEPTTPARGLALFLNGGPRMDYPLNLLVCRALAVGGWRAVRFNYRYQDHPGLEPVRKEQLEDAERVLRAAGQAAEAGPREAAAQAASGNGGSQRNPAPAGGGGAQGARRRRGHPGARG